MPTPTPPATPTAGPVPARSGRSALEATAPEAAAALDQMVATTWAVAVRGDHGRLVEGAARVIAATHDLSPLRPPPGGGATDAGGPTGAAGHDPTSWRARADLSDGDRAALAFAEQMAIDVAALDDTQRAAIGASLGTATGEVVQAFWVLDMVPRVRAALDALFGPSTWPTPAPLDEDTPADLWATVDRFLRVVPRLDHLDPVLTELVRLRGARQHRCRLCQSLRSRPALLAGAGDEDFAAVDDPERSELPEATRAALALTDAVIWHPGRIDGELTARLAAALDEAQRVELVLDVARNAANKIAVAFAADAPHVTEGYEIYEIDAEGEAVYGLTLD